MRVARILHRAALVGLVLFLAVGLSQAAEFTATTVTKTGGTNKPGKIYVKGNKARHEIKLAGQTSIQILRPDKNVVWVIMPNQKTYMEMPLDQEAHQKMFLNLTEKQKARMKKVGTETVNQYECDKYETTMPYRGKSTKFYVYLAPELGVPIKMETQNGSFSTELQDIKTGQLKDSLFERPQGYKKIKIPLSMPPRK
jgi:outer membrane lipoprotein-sorting protein